MDRVEDPILEVLICENHGKIWERRKSGSRALPLFYVGAWDGYCEKCVRDLFELTIPPLKRISPSLEEQMEKEDYGERVILDMGGLIEITEANSDA